MRQVPSSNRGLRKGAASLMYPHLLGTITISTKDSILDFFLAVINRVAVCFGKWSKYNFFTEWLQNKVVKPPKNWIESTELSYMLVHTIYSQSHFCTVLAISGASGLVLPQILLLFRNIRLPVMLPCHCCCLPLSPSLYLPILNCGRKE